MNKKLIAPIVAVVALLIKQAFGYELTNEMANLITDAVLAIVALVGIFMEPKKASPTPSEVEHIQQNHGGGAYKTDGGGEQ